MQRTIFTLLLFFKATLVFGQTKVVSSEILSQQATAKLFTDSLNKQLGITYPIRRVYKCTDKSGQFFMVLTESNDTITEDKDTLHYKIKAFNIGQDKSGLLKQWEMNDFITKQATSDYMENSIWFWTKYSEFTDIDNDSLIDPILIYGTSGMNYTSDGRIKFLIYYRGQKIAIRHQNGVLDFERHIQVDREFYSVPLKLQEHVKQIMKKMTVDRNAIFPSGWQKAMNDHKLYFDEDRKTGTCYGQNSMDTFELKKFWVDCVNPIINWDKDKLEQIVYFPLDGDWGYMIGLKKPEQQWTKDDFFNNLQNLFNQEFVDKLKKTNL